MQPFDYSQIAKFLDKFKKLLNNKEEDKKIIIEIIFKEINYKIENENLKIKNGYIFIKASPLVKNEIFIHKKNILSKLKEVIPEINFTDLK